MSWTTTLRDRLAQPVVGSLASLVVLFAACALLVALRNVTTDSPQDSVSEQRPLTGSWHFPRGGPYVLGFDSPNGNAELSIDGQVIARGRGQKQVRRVYPAKIATLRFSAPVGARLLWHPPGRRGPLEYVPDSSLWLDPSTQPESSSSPRPGTSIADGLWAAGVLLLILIWIGFCSRSALRTLGRRQWTVIIVVFALALIIRLLDLGGAGQTWDEDVNWSAGRNYLANILSADFSIEAWRWNLQHPPITKYFAGLGAHFADGYGPARVVSAVWVAMGCVLLVPIGQRVWSLRAGACAGVLAALSPHLIAHGKVVGHEAPTILWWTLAVFLCIRAFDGVAEDKRSASKQLAWRFAIIGAVFGVAIMTRFVNLLLAPLIGGLLLTMAPKGLRKTTIWLGLLVIPIAAIAVSFVVWPRLWSEPITHLGQSWAILKKPHSAEPFLGAITNNPPRYYFAVYLFATAPLGLLLASTAGAFACVRHRWRSGLVVGLWLAVPLLVAFSPVRQDGVRYIMPSLVALAMLAGIGVDYVATLASKKLGRGFLYPLITLIVGGYMLMVCARIHPYYLDYYGEQVGGPSAVAAKKNFEIAWWGEGVSSAIDFVNKHAAPRARVYKACVEPSHLTWLRHDLWAFEARSPKHADWFIHYQPAWRECPIPADAILVHEVQAQGAPLCKVYRAAR